MANSALERQCTLLINADVGSILGSGGGGDKSVAASGGVDVAALRKDLEAPELPKKMEALKRILMLHLNGEKMDNMLMSVIRYILPHEDAHLRKLGLYFLETVDKKGPDGSMLPEMILVVNMIRNDLVHANEYTRGCALRFCCKLNDAQLLEPLVPSVRANLEHRHSYVRRNAVLAIHNIFLQFDFLLPDAPELIDEFLRQEGDLSCRRNAIMMLIECDRDRAVVYMHDNIQQVALWSETLQLSALELIRQVCKANPAEKGKYIQVIFALLNSPSPAVLYQAAKTLISLSSAPTAIRAAAQCYCMLLASQSDQNVKLILLDRLLELKKSHSHVLQELIMDVLRALSSPNMDIRRKCLALAMDLVTNRNVEEVVEVLKKELMKTQVEMPGSFTHSSSHGPGMGIDASSEANLASAYRQMLIKAIHTIALRFNHVAAAAVNILAEFISDAFGASSGDVVVFMREACEIFPNLRGIVLEKLLGALKAPLVTPSVIRGIVWILGEYATTPAEVRDSFSLILGLIGPFPLRAEKPVEADSAASKEPATPTTPVAATAAKKKPTILSDGTYASQIAENTAAPMMAAARVDITIRQIVLDGEFFVGVAICSALSKLALRLSLIPSAPADVVNRVKAEAMLACASLIMYGRSGAAPINMDEGSAARLIGCIRALNGELPAEVYLNSSREAYVALVNEKKQKELRDAKELAKRNRVSVEALVEFELLRSRRVQGGVEDVSGGSDDTAAAMLGADETGTVKRGANSSFTLDRVIQLTGLSDPVYAEAHVLVGAFDIFLDVVVLNKSNDTLQAVTLELATMGDLRLCERPATLTLGPGDQKSIRANIKVSSSDTGIIFGNIVYDVAGAGGQSGCIILNDIHIDIMDYIRPGEVSDTLFRSMWAEFEWENKVVINTPIQDLAEYLDYILATTNMKCLTLRGMENESGFLAANLYASSVFGEDALVNVSAEKAPDGSLAGYVRIRSKTQGIALSLGDKITLKQVQRKQ